MQGGGEEADNSKRDGLLDSFPLARVTIPLCPSHSFTIAESTPALALHEVSKASSQHWHSPVP